MNDEESKKEEYLEIYSNITQDGINITVKGKSYSIKYPIEVWKGYNKSNKDLLLDNLSFMQTCHLPASHKMRGAKYNTAIPLFETFAFKGTMYDIPSTAVIDHEKTTDYLRRFFNSSFKFSSYETATPHQEKVKRIIGSPKAVVLFTAGKESLLNLALCMEMGIKPIPVYMDEAPDGPESMHKQKIISTLENEYGLKVYKIVNEPGKLRYCDLGEEENNWGAGTQFLTYILEIMPFVKKFNAEYVFFGNEYSCDDYIHDKEGFKSNFCFDQCTEWTKQLNMIAQVMTGNTVKVGSLVAPLYEIGLIKVLHERYPELAKLQMSCFSDTKEGKTRIWCGNCSKCARMFAFFKALDIETEQVGFENNMFNKKSKGHYSVFGGKGLYSYDVSGLGSEEQSLALYMAAQKGINNEVVNDFKKTKAYRDIEKGFDKAYKKYFSIHDSIAVPEELKEKVMLAFSETLSGTGPKIDFRNNIIR